MMLEAEHPTLDLLKETIAPDSQIIDDEHDEFEENTAVSLKSCLKFYFY
jgi:hypothetical protein